MEEPKELISKEKMVNILYDIALLNAIDNTYPHVLESHEIKVMGFISEKYGVDSTQFVTSDRYYASVPGLYKEIYETVEARLEQNRDSITQMIKENNSKNGDSLDISKSYD